MKWSFISWGAFLGMCLATLALPGDSARPCASIIADAPGRHNCSDHSETLVTGRKVFVNPKDGRIVPRPIQPGDRPHAVAQNDLNSSSEGLREAPGRTKGGGMKVHLQGRFRSTVSAVVESDGRLTTRCQTDLAEPMP